MSDTEPHHETRDVPACLPLRVIVLMVLFVPLGLGIIGGLMSTVWAPPPSPATPFTADRPVETPAPRLQAIPQRDLAAFEARMTRELTHYGWVDREAGIVRLPIERAMALLVERGLPDTRGPVSDRREPPHPSPDAATEWLAPPSDAPGEGDTP
ncbi:hypothetical protein [Halomonas stenophila]|uniref:Uncharacterized protein n=1 Tax=Halomonas stenophila TaxID=795312 RepID=A0A7W5ET10_9GAMM|nr:hypothetical protein [Halomonas stenophila]MBB3230943.1 hypothetical protein [Halomonas stenophila]